MALMNPQDDRQMKLAEYRAAILTRTKQTIQSVIEIGQYLIAARKIIRRGQWAEFLTEVHLSDDRARKLMRLADAFGEMQTLPHLPVTQFEDIMRVLESPRARKQFLETPDLEAMSPEQVKETLLSHQSEAERLKAEARQQRSRADKAEAELQAIDRDLANVPAKVRQANIAVRSVDMAVAECIQAVEALPNGHLGDMDSVLARSVQKRLETLFSLLGPVLSGRYSR